MLTESALLDRVRAVCLAQQFVEAPGLDFARVPAQAADRSFALRYAGQTPTGGMSFAEEARGTVMLSILRVIRSDYACAQRDLLADARALLVAVVEDGAVTSGEYAVEDGGRSIDVQAPRGANYLVGMLRIPVNFEALVASEE
jgi:hypothetical protein